jgi:hypothetical protein
VQGSRFKGAGLSPSSTASAAGMNDCVVGDDPACACEFFGGAVLAARRDLGRLSDKLRIDAGKARYLGLPRERYLGVRRGAGRRDAAPSKSGRAHAVPPTEKILDHPLDIRNGLIAD